MKDDRYLTVEEDGAIAKALCAASGDFTEIEFAAAVRWAERIRIEQDCLELVLQGLVALRLRPDGEIEMRTIGPHPDDLVEGNGVLECSRKD